MEKLSETRKRRSSSESEDEKPKRQRRNGSDAMEFLVERAKINYELKQEELKMWKEQQGLERETDGSYDQTAAANTTTANRNATGNATTATEHPNDDDAAATRTVKGYDGPIRKINQ